jgi:hypothetical protein
MLAMECPFGENNDCETCKFSDMQSSSDGCDEYYTCNINTLIQLVIAKLAGSKPIEPMYEDCSDDRCFINCFLCAARV